MLNAIVAGAVIIVILYTLAIFVRCSIEMHQLKVETHRLRISYLRRLAALRSGAPDPEAELVGVDIVEEPSGDAGAPSDAASMEQPEQPEIVVAETLEPAPRAAA